VNPDTVTHPCHPEVEIHSNSLLVGDSENKEERKVGRGELWELGEGN